MSVSENQIRRAQYHEELAAAAKKMVMDAYNYNQNVGQRIQHPAYKGMGQPMAGSFNRPFFLNKDEAHISLEEKLSGGGNAGALWNPAGRKYAKKILNRRAIQSNELLAGMPASAPAAMEGVSAELKQQLDTAFSQLIDIVNENNTQLYSEAFSASTRIYSLLVSVAPTLNAAELGDYNDKLEGILRLLYMSSGFKVDRANALESAPRFYGILNETLSRSKAFVDDFLATGVNLSTLKERQLRAKAVFRKNFPNVDKATKKIINQNITAIAEEAEGVDVDELVQEQGVGEAGFGPFEGQQTGITAEDTQLFYEALADWANEAQAIQAGAGSAEEKFNDMKQYALDVFPSWADTYVQSASNIAELSQSIEAVANDLGIPLTAQLRRFLNNLQLLQRR